MLIHNMMHRFPPRHIRHRQASARAVRCLSATLSWMVCVPVCRVVLAVLLTVLPVAAGAVSTYKVQCYDNLTRDILDMGDIAQDHKGFIWLSTSTGLYRFDGYQFKRFPFPENQEWSVTAAIDHMESDSKGHLWLRSGNRAFHFDTDNYTFSNPLKALEEDMQRTFVVRGLRCSPDGKTWMYCDDGTILMATGIAKPKSVVVAARCKEKITGIYVKDETLWVAVDNGSYMMQDGGAPRKVGRGETMRLVRRDIPKSKAYMPFHRDRFGKNWERDDIDAPGLKAAPNVFKDNQDNLWYVCGKSLYRISFHAVNHHELESETQPMRWAMRDRVGRTWISNRYNKRIAIYGKDNALTGYLSAEGRLSESEAKFPARVYVMFQDSYGTVWIGTKPHGLFCVREYAPGLFHIDNINTGNSRLNDNEVIDIAEDSQHRIWICGFRNGLSCITNAAEIARSAAPGIAGNVKVVALSNTLKDKTVADIKFRRLIYTRQHALLAATSVGLVVYDTRQPLARLSKGEGVTLHQHDANDTTSMTSSVLKTAVETSDGKVYVCTRDAGINLLTSASVFDKTLRFRHYDTRHGFPTDYITSAFESDGALWVTSVDNVIEWHPERPLPASAVKRMTYEVCDFSESNPCQRADGSWVIGTQEGCIAVNLDDLRRQNVKPRHIYPIVITSFTDNDTITLAPDERSLNLSFATLDYGGAQHICYAVRLVGDDNDDWQYLGATHDISFQHLEPGEYTLEIRSTDSQGEWLDNTRRISVYVTPAFYETWTARLLALAFIALLAYLAFRLWQYIQRIQHQQRETLDAYMQLLADKEQHSAQRHDEYRKGLLQQAKVEVQNDEFIKKVVRHIEQHIGDSDIDIDTMAQELAVSRSQLNHKLKHILGVTPSEMIREARIKHACTLLEDNTKNINDIAYACGFTDPKYFSKCFKASTGYSPTNYRLKM